MMGAPLFMILVPRCLEILHFPFLIQVQKEEVQYTGWHQNCWTVVGNQLQRMYGHLE